MIRRWSSTRYHRAAGTGDDTDALQTDVMRFMSILGLCLMAVFALVQSLPLHDAESMQEDVERSRLVERIVLQQQHAGALKAELQRLLSLLERANAERVEAERALSDAAQQLTKVIERTEQARTEQLRVSSELRRLKQRLTRGRQALASLQLAADDRAMSLRTLQRRLAAEVRELDEIRRKAHVIKLQRAEEESRQAARARERQREEDQRRKEEQHRQAALRHAEEQRKQDAGAKISETRATPSPITEEQEPKPAQKGFTLRFASENALQQQVASGGVSLFAMADKQAWRLSLPEGRPVFTDAAFPAWFHEMAASTVPDEFVKQLRIFVPAKTRGSVVWGVQLPSATTQEIAALTRGRKGGDLVIASSGRVSLTGE